MVEDQGHSFQPPSHVPQPRLQTPGTEFTPRRGAGAGEGNSSRFPKVCDYVHFSHFDGPQEHTFATHT